MESIITYLGLALGFFGILASYYFYRRSIKIKEPVYSIRSNNLISDYSSKYTNLTVLYDGQKVEDFTVSKILFYNRGTETIYRQDIATLNQLKILAETGNILDARVLQTNNLSSDFKVNLDKANEWVIIDFDYLNLNQGAVIEIIHNGTSSENIAIRGDIKGVHKLVKLLPNTMASAEDYEVELRSFLKQVIVPMLITFIAVLIVEKMQLPPSHPLYPLPLLAFLLALVSIVRFSYGNPKIFSTYNMIKLIPKGLERFLE